MVLSFFKGSNINMVSEVKGKEVSHKADWKIKKGYPYRQSQCRKEWQLNRCITQTMLPKQQ